MLTKNRPLSPHLQVYRPQLTSLLSITHRGTGMFLAFSSPVLVYWLWAIAAGPETYASAQGLLGSSLGRVILFFWSYSLFYHLCNGIRHLAWDAGLGLEITTLYKSGWWVVAVSFGLTMVTWIIGYAARGGSG
jgi:succinate dehydrogenase / fumarate reductase cytochrome b subunit